ncbi:hypothetical protein ACWGB8_00355 [Kitasatospora sp. NPDC054939]
MTEQESPRLPEQRSGRHAAPRTPVRIRLRGRALAMAAVPTALLMAATYAPTTAAADPADKPCATAPDAPPQVAETPVPKSELTPPAPSTAPTQAPSAQPTTALTTAPTQAPSVPAQPTTAAPGTGPSAVPTTAPVARSAGSTGSVLRTGIIDDIVGGIVDGVTDLVHPGSSSTAAATAAPQPTTAPPAAGPSQAPAAPAAGARAAAPTADPGAGQPAPTTPAASPSPKASTKPAARPTAPVKPSAKSSSSAKPGTPAPSGSPSADPNCPVDISGLRAAGRPDNPILVPDQNWTLQTTRLALDNSRFHGVVDVKTPTGTKRVLKFVVDNVEIDNLDMSTLEGNGKTFHVKGAPGSTSTMRSGPVTMYVERLSGHLSKVIGLPVPIDLGEITLTPDTLPQWLYDLIGTFPIPLDLELTGVTAVQAGQFGGTLKIPGMKMYNDDIPYVGNK